MKNIRLLPERYDVAPLRAELAAHPNIWGRYPWRTEHPRSPHRDATDIWVRYNSIENLGPRFNDEHEPIWYPVCESIPAAKALALQVFESVGGKFGGVLITKIPPAKQVYPHIDMGWHALYYEKIAIQVQGNERQAFHFEDGSLSPKSGASFWFNNQASHWVTNDSDEDRISLIVCIRRTH